MLSDQNRYCTVFYFFELDNRRKYEALKAADNLGFDCSFNTVLLTPGYIEQFDEVYVPSRVDWHVDHRKVNKQYRLHATHFYSVDMVQGYPLLERSQTKREFLDACYPSQSGLWNTDAKYYLFEDIQRCDFDSYSISLVDQYKVKALSKYRTVIETTWATQCCGDPHKDFNLLLSMCMDGSVTLTNESRNLILESK